MTWLKGAGAPLASSSRVARISQRGDFLRGGNNTKRTWPKFLLILNQIEAVFLSRSGDLKKKVFARIETVFTGEIRWSPKKKAIAPLPPGNTTDLECALKKQKTTGLLEKCFHILFQVIITN